MSDEIKAGVSVLRKYLTDALGESPYSAFEQNDTADLTIKGIKFSMRIGTYMGRPMQAIIALGVFVRMREATEYAGCILNPLDPKNPTNSLYEYDRRHDHATNWIPKGTSLLVPNGGTKRRRRRGVWQR